MKRYILFGLTCIICGFVYGQRKITPTDSFIISGKVKQEKVYTLADLELYPQKSIGPQVVYNQRGEVKDTIKNIKGVSLKSLFDQIEFVYDKPKELNEFYFIFQGSDGYRVVFSWNEIFNTETGNNLYIITESEGKKLKDIDDRIKFLSAADFKVGRRNIHALAKIIVKQLD